MTTSPQALLAEAAKAVAAMVDRAERTETAPEGFVVLALSQSEVALVVELLRARRADDPRARVLHDFLREALGRAEEQDG